MHEFMRTRGHGESWIYEWMSERRKGRGPGWTENARDRSNDPRASVGDGPTRYHNRNQRREGLDLFVPAVTLYMLTYWYCACIYIYIHICWHKYLQAIRKCCVSLLEAQKRYMRLRLMYEIQSIGMSATSIDYVIAVYIQCTICRRDNSHVEWNNCDVSSTRKFRNFHSFPLLIILDAGDNDACIFITSLLLVLYLSFHCKNKVS